MKRVLILVLASAWGCSGGAHPGAKSSTAASGATYDGGAHDGTGADGSEGADGTSPGKDASTRVPDGGADGALDGGRGHQLPGDIAVPLRTRGRYIVDKHGKRVKLAAVNWYGASDVKKVPGGLDVARLADIAATIRKLGFNAVRLPFASALLTDTSLDASAVAANPELASLTPLEVYDRVVEALTQAGVLVVLNNHTTHFMWCCNFDADGLWHTSDHSEDQWVEDWATMVKRYANNPYVIAADLRNEVRIPSDNPANIPTWAGVTADWRNAAERAGARVLSENPDLLVIVEGVNFPRDHLKGVRNDPIRLPLPHRTVYAAHNYGYIGPQLTGTKYGEMDWPTFKQQMDTEWGYVIEEGRAYTAPVWVSEFGEGHDRTPWWDNITRYLREGDFDFAYWAINPGPKASGDDEPYGLLERDWVTPLADDYRLKDLAAMQKPTRGPGVEAAWADDPEHHFEVLLFGDWDTPRAEPVIDWQPSTFKATCANAARVVGMSAGHRTNELFAHTALCSDYGAKVSGTRTLVASSGSDSPSANAHTGGTDWSTGFTKLECPLGQAVVGVSQTRTATVYQIAGILCAEGELAQAGPCHEQVFDNADARTVESGGDWDNGYTKGQCGLEEYVAGISLSTGRPHGLLCCAATEP